MIACRDCEHDNADDALFCENCGERLDPVCPGCGRQNRAGAKFCRFCRTAVPQPVVPAVDAPAPAAAPVEVEPDLEPEDAEPASPADEPEEPGPSLLEEHRAAVRAYAGQWFDPDARAFGMSSPEAAYYLLQHAGMIYRYTGDPELLGGLRAAVGSDRHRLLAEACEYAAGLSLARAAVPLLDDALESEQVEQLFDLLLARDGAEEALRAARELADEPGYRDDPTVRADLARAACAVAEVDELLLPRPDLLAAVAGQFDPIREALAVPIDATRQWWLLHPTGPDAEEVDPDALTALAAPPRAAAPTPAAEPIVATEPATTPAPPAPTPLAEPAPEREASANRLKELKTEREVEYTIGAASGRTETQDRTFHSPDDPSLCGVLLVIQEETHTAYNFLFHTRERVERNLAWDGGAVVAETAGPSAEAPVANGRATVRLTASPVGFRLRAPSGLLLRLQIT